MIKRFIKCSDLSYSDNIQYYAGRVCFDGKRYKIGYEQLGAKETFSVGMPVYDTENNLMGFLGITLCENLDYSSDVPIKENIPVEIWEICKPTKYCQPQKEVRTYYQRWNNDNSD